MSVHKMLRTTAAVSLASLGTATLALQAQAKTKTLPEQIADVIALVTEAGGIDSARRRGEQFAHEAEEALTGLPDTPARAALADAILYVMDRRS